MDNYGISIDGISTSSAVWGGSTIITPDVESVVDVRVRATITMPNLVATAAHKRSLLRRAGATPSTAACSSISIGRGLNVYQHRLTFAGNSSNPQRQTARFNQYGGSVGGPFWKNKVFGFFAYETSPNNSTTTGSGWYDTAAFDAPQSPGSISSKYLTFPGAGVTSTGIIPSTCAGIGLVEGVNCNTIAGQGSHRISAESGAVSAGNAGPHRNGHFGKSGCRRRLEQCG